MADNNTQKDALQNFKKFVANHPKLSGIVKKGEKSWQEMFEEWYILGSDDEYWKDFEKEKDEIVKTETESTIENKSSDTENTAKTMDVIGQFLQLIKGVDLQSLQGHVENLSTVVTNVQSLVRQFSGSAEDKTENETSSDMQSHRDMNKPPSNPFYFYKD